MICNLLIHPWTSAVFVKDSYFTRKLALDAERGTEYQLDESYGEQQEEHVSPVICVLNVANMAVSVIQDFPDLCAPAQAIWAPDDNGKLQRKCCVDKYLHLPMVKGCLVCYQIKETKSSFWKLFCFFRTFDTSMEVFVDICGCMCASSI